MYVSNATLFIALPVFVLSNQVDEFIPDLIPGFQVVYQTGLQCQPGGVTTFFGKVAIQVVDVVVDSLSRQPAQGGHIGRVSLPQHGQPGLVGFPVIHGHVVSHKGFQGRFVGTNPENMKIDVEFVQGVLEIVAVNPQPAEPNLSHRMQVKPIGMCGQIILPLIETVTEGKDGFSRRL